MGRGFDAERPSEHVEPIVGKAIKPALPTNPMTRDVYVHAGAIATLDGGGSGPVKGPGHDVSDHTLPAGHGFVIEDGRFTAIAPWEELVDVDLLEPSKPGLVHANGSETIWSLAGRGIVPGLVDAHTHLLWSGDRSDEVRWRHEGLNYFEIASRGGGIGATVRATREATDDELLSIGRSRIEEAKRHGTAHMEVKTGYGLSTSEELRLLSLSDALNGHEGVSLDPTWLGAHDRPPEHNDIRDYVDEIRSEQMPQVLEQGIARSADVFCEPGWFDLEQTEDILRDAKQGGMDLRLHLDEFKQVGGAHLAAELGVTTADHVHHTTSPDRAVLAESGVMHGFLPGTPFSMGTAYPPWDEVQENGQPWSAATDFNPNCRILSLPFIGSILVQRTRIHPLAALVAVSRNPATTTPHPDDAIHGRIGVGAIGSFNVLDAPTWTRWCLSPGSSPFTHGAFGGQQIESLR